MIFLRSNREFGEQDETMMDQASYFRSRPPRCLAGFTARPAELLGVEFDGHVSMSQFKFDAPGGVTIHAPEHTNPLFALSCRCGGIRHYVHCHRWANPDFRNQVVTLSPLDLECAACGTITPLLDTDAHGYDAELGHGTATARAQGERVVFECVSCGRQPIEAFVRFEYPDYLFDGDFPEFAGRAQELFTWFNLVGRCSGCSQVLPIADFECA
jgi:hypothetical protein